MFGKTLWSEKNHPGKVHQFAQVYLPLGCFLKTLKNAHFLQALKFCFMAPFFKCCHLMTDKDFSTKPTANFLNFPWDKANSKNLNALQSFSNLKSGLNLSRNLNHFQEILVQSNKAVLDTNQHNLSWWDSVTDILYLNHIISFCTAYSF